MNVALCWGGVSGYMAACWHELASRPGIDLLVFNFAGQFNSAFNEGLLAGLNCRFLPADQSNPAAAIRSILQEHGTQVLSLSGWMYDAYRELAADPTLRHIPMMMVMDTPLVRSWRQRLARFKIASYLARMDRIIVPGERSWQYARYLGVPERKVRRAAYGVDYAGLSPLYARRAVGDWPRRFLFTGRYIEEKGVDVLLAAYRKYRAQAREPWPLTCCGMGPLKNQLLTQAGVEDLGFVQPQDLGGIMERSGAFVLASRYDPWPLVVVEACAAGLPVICTESCGSAVELVRGYHNGLTVATDDADALAQALLWMHEHHAELPDFGRRAQHFAAAYSAQAWADRWMAILHELAGSQAAG